MDARADAVEATRQRILDAARPLFFELWYDEVTLNGIAAAAGVSHQTVLNHFGSKDGVFGSLAEALRAETLERRDAVEPGDTASAVARLLAQYEEFGLANARAAAVEHKVPVVKEVLDDARRGHREWVERTFAPSLPPSGPARRRKVAAYLAATEVTAWKTLRHDYGFTEADTAAAITALVTALEAQP